MEITINQLQELYKNGETQDKKFKIKIICPWVEMKSMTSKNDFSYCDMIFLYNNKEYLVTIKKHHINSKILTEKVQCIEL